MRIRPTGALILTLCAALTEPPASSAGRYPVAQSRKVVIAVGREPILGSVDWSPDDRELACVVGVRRVAFVDSRTGRPTRKPWAVRKPLYAFVPTANWQRAAILDAGGRVRLWDMRSRRFLRELPGVSEPEGLAWSRDGSRLAVTLRGSFLSPKPSQGGFYPLQANWGNQIRIFAAGSGRRVRTLRHASRDGTVEGHDFEGFEAVWSPDGRRLATVLLRSGRIRESPVHLWDPETGGLLHQWGRLRSRVRETEGTDCFNAPAWSPDSRHLAATDGLRLWIWEACTGRLVRLLALDHPVQQIVWSPDGRILAARSFPDYWGDDAGHTAYVYLWEGRSYRRLRTLSVPNRSLYDMAWSRRGRQLAAAGRDGIVRIWDL